MSYEEANDDYATAKPPYKVIAALAVHGRLPLLKHTIERLYKKNGCFKVICSGDNPEDKQLCQSLGAVWVHARNKPLGNKWNQAFFKANEFSPDAVVFVGSSDWISDNWFQIMRPYLDKYGFAGVPGCSLADIGDTIRTLHWKGYKGYSKEREDETIGSGRMLSRRMLEDTGWLPFNPILDNSLDRSMKDRAYEAGFNDFMVHDDRLKSLSISTNKWPNKHKFEMHWSGMIPSEKIELESVLKDFPELNKIFE